MQKKEKLSLNFIVFKVRNFLETALEYDYLNLRQQQDKIYITSAKQEQTSLLIFYHEFLPKRENDIP